MNWLELVGAIVGTGGVAGVAGALIGRPKVRAEARKIEVEAEARLSESAVATVEGLMGPLRDEVSHLATELAESRSQVDHLADELAAARQTIATQQQTIAEQQRTTALQNTQLAETRSELVVLNRAFLALQDWVRAQGADPVQILAAAGHPPTPAVIPNT